jgi:hypothetical protein
MLGVHVGLLLGAHNTSKQADMRKRLMKRTYRWYYDRGNLQVRHIAVDTYAAVIAYKKVTILSKHKVLVYCMRREQVQQQC